MDYPNCASWRVIPLIVEGKTREVHFAQPTRQGRRVRARNFQNVLFDMVDRFNEA